MHSCEIEDDTPVIREKKSLKVIWHVNECLQYYLTPNSAFADCPGTTLLPRWTWCSRQSRGGPSLFRHCCRIRQCQCLRLPGQGQEMMVMQIICLLFVLSVKV